MEGLNYIAAAIAVFGSALAAAYGNGKVISKTIESITRQPELSSELKGTMFIGVGIIEAVPILGIVIALLLIFM
ncbi:F0F1 ATP synthase subunit C [Vagococcus zengguangii]|uniref:ATP synthase subunit c n=1 Tax=Vagococcus zengguangii TaxID=2571750 RepID=A0A4D7CQ08_9ENTE|nr:F0F1 ATP synthase subunit C [Vagococcus zengguangii]QCI86168.1 F0F1 ATP synthase subunit C [Vagococcus zengguangii]TLG79867.1 F0F1 ATP synthase subunit C [Vagococcus zengguangii]